MGFKKIVKYTSPAGFVALKAAETVAARKNNADDESEQPQDAQAPKIGKRPDLDWKARGTNLTADEVEAGVLWTGMSHEAGRNAHVRLYADRIEREKKASRIAVVKAAQDNEVIPIRSVTSVNIKRSSAFLSLVTVLSAGGGIPFRFRHEDAQAFKQAIMPLVLAAGQPQAAQPTDSIADKLLKLGQLRDANVITTEEFEAKKGPLLEQM